MKISTTYPCFEKTSSIPTSLFIPEEADLSFEGFSENTFEILERLRQNPHIDQYRKEKTGIKSFVSEPFRRYRDDLVVNWVLPNQLPYETERNVFSRILKNDFGAGGSHSHLWMSFYRLGRQRLTDYQIIHSISPDGFSIGLYFGASAPELKKRTKARILALPSAFLDLINPLLRQNIWDLVLIFGSGKTKKKLVCSSPLAGLPDAFGRVNGFWIRKRLSREKVLHLRSGLIRTALELIDLLWPVYLFYLDEQE